MPNIVLTLGDVTFADTEIPEHIKIKTKQQQVVHKFVGGARQVDTLGADHDPIPFSGIFIGSNALDRALTLKSMCDSGLPIELSWSEFYYQVTIDTFEADYERDYQIPYAIALTVVQDLTNPVGATAGDSMDDLVNGDMGTCTALSSSIGDPPTMSAMSSLGAAVSAVSSFATATKAEIQSVLTPLAQARTVVTNLIASTDNILQSVLTLGGVLPNNPALTNANRLFSQITAVQNQGNLIQLNAVLGRMGTNLGQINSGVKTVNVGGGTLFDLASKYYGNVAGWTALQTANPQLKGDPNINGNQTISIPPYAGDPGGSTIA